MANRGGIIHCNIEHNELNKLVSVDVAFNCDSRYFFENIIKQIYSKHRTTWLNQINDWKIQHPFTFNKLPNQLINTQYVLHKLNKYIHNHEYLQKILHITTGVGNHQMMSCQFINWSLPNRLVTSGSLGVMGVGLPYAMGLSIASNSFDVHKAIVLDIDGDSSFNMTFSELKTIVQYNIPVKIMIMNDNSQSMVRTWESEFFDGRITATTNDCNPLYHKFNNVFPTLKTLFCDKKKQVYSTIDTLFKYNDGPILCEFIVNPDKCFPLVPPDNALDNPINH